MLRVGITGGMGSGKSTVCRIFSVLGIPVYNADWEAKQLYDTHPELKQQMLAQFGDQIYPAGIFDAKVMRALLQQHPEWLSTLNAIVHPVVKQHSEEWFQQQKTIYALKESALLVESLAYMHLHTSILVSAPESIRKQRIQHRDAITVEEMEYRMKHQFSDEQKRAFCEYEIVNDEEQALIPQVLALHERLLQRASSTS